MIRHILKKDFRLLWLLAAVLVVVQFALVFVDFQLGHFNRDDEALRSLLLLLEIAVYFGGGCMIAVLVHQDALVGARQDWLSRPIRRRDLLAAKLIFVLITIHAPMLLAELGEGLAAGFSFSHSLLPALSQNLWFLVAFTLPVFALASLTRSMTQAIATTLCLFLAVLCWDVLLKGWTGNPLGPTGGSAIGWVPDLVRLLIYLLASVAILCLQYFRRKTVASRIVLGAAVVLCLLTQTMPWRYAFHWEQAVSKVPASAHQIALQFDASLGRFRAPVSAGIQSNLHDVAYSSSNDATKLYLPLEVTGLPADSILKIDRAFVYAVSSNGSRRIVLSSANNSDDLEVLDDGTRRNGTQTLYEPVQMRHGVYRRMKNAPVSLVIDYSITLLNLASVHELRAFGGNMRSPDAGWCQTNVNDNQTEIEARCLQDGPQPQCDTFFLQNPATGARNPDIHGCLDDYAPWFGRYKPLDTMTLAGANLLFRDSAGLVRYPVGGSQITSSRVVIRSYQPAAHITRHLVIFGVNLADWTAE
jgi:hypothetical protein